MKVTCMICNRDFQISPVDQDYEKYDKMSKEERKGYICEHCSARIKISANVNKRKEHESS